ncbi:hypothetical protein PoB_003155500 [Plakobranchus ocellatus]|uniref:Uncharacterized protein n=1 Tax=Plakobranchus ocellatus TaxID=259542 RepID=A0AAV4AA58_9GAST|nr:hypothetical protein PoB_003155500 [Plakobranchus ocellatus]
MASAPIQPLHANLCSMFLWDDRGDGRLTDTIIAEHTRACVHSPWTSYPRLYLPATNQTKNDTHVYLGVVMRKITLGLKHNARRRYRKNVWTTTVLQTLDTIRSQKPVSIRRLKWENQTSRILQKLSYLLSHILCT